MGFLDKVSEKKEGVTINSSQQEKEGVIINPLIPNQEKKEDKEEKESLWLSTLEQSDESKKFCLVIGEKSELGTSDRTGKTGIILDTIVKKLRKDKTEKCYFIDIDDGLRKLVQFHPNIANQIYTYKPLQLKIKNSITSIDYLNTINEIRLLITFLKENYIKLNIKSIVFDGLSTYLKWCSDQMKEEKFIAPDGTFNSMAYWKIRNQYFFETMLILKQLPIDIYLIGHDNFLNFDQEIMMGGKKIKLGALQKDLNNMVHQRIICSKHKDKNGNRVLKAYIDKSSNVLKEEKTYEFMNIIDGKVVFDSSKVFEGL